MLFDVFCRRLNAHIRQSGPSKVELAKLRAIYFESILCPVALCALPRLGGCFAPFLRVVKYLALRRLNRLIRHIGGINNTRICFEAVLRAHMGIMPSFSNCFASVREISSRGAAS